MSTSPRAGDSGHPPEVDPPEPDRDSPYVATAEQRRRWDPCAAIAEKLFDGSEGAGAVIWQTVRVLYHGNLPTA